MGWRDLFGLFGTIALAWHPRGQVGLPRANDEVRDVITPNNSPLGRVATMVIMREPPQAVAFIAPSRTDATLTAARELVGLLSELAYKVILVRWDLPGCSGDGVSSYTPETPTLRRQVQIMARRSENAPYHELWLGCSTIPGSAATVARNDPFWQHLKGTYDFIVIESPAMAQNYDGIALAARADATVIVLDAQSTPRSELVSLRAALENATAQILGVLLTQS